MHKLLRAAGVLATVGWLVSGAPAPATGPTAPPPDDGFLDQIPAEAFFHLERRGHRAIREAFRASNLGSMAADDAIEQFVRDSRVRIGRMIAKGVFDLKTEADITRHHAMIHGLTKPFWYQPCAMFAVLDRLQDAGTVPSLGFICRTGPYRDECRKAVDALLKAQVPPPGQAGQRQGFRVVFDGTTWHGVARHYEDWTLPADTQERLEALTRDRWLFMTCWKQDTLYVTTTLLAAELLSPIIAGQGRPAVKAADPNVAAVAAKTGIKDWAFRWHLDTALLWDEAPGPAAREDFLEVLTYLGVDRLRGMGGTGGYLDGVYARKTYLYMPRLDWGILRVWRAGGSYRAAMAMVPRNATVVLAGQLDPTAVRQSVQGVAAAVAGGSFEAPATMTADGRPAGPPTIQLFGKSARVAGQIDRLIEASDGNAAFFVDDCVAAMGMMMMGGPPVGAVLGIQDRDEAAAAIEALVRLAGADDDAEPDNAPPPPRPTAYRKVPLRYIGEMFRMAILNDRVAFAMSDATIRSLIDTALDKTGGFAPDGKAEALLKPLDGGPAVFQLDLAGLARAFWPLLIQFGASMPQDFPLASMPSPLKMHSLLGPEVAVFKPDAAGVLLDSRGQVPFSTKFMIYPVIMLGMMGVF